MCRTVFSVDKLYFFFICIKYIYPGVLFLCLLKRLHFRHPFMPHSTFREIGLRLVGLYKSLCRPCGPACPLRTSISKTPLAWVEVQINLSIINFSPVGNFSLQQIYCIWCNSLPSACLSAYMSALQYISACLSLSVCIIIYLYLSAYLYLWLYTFQYFSICLHIYISVCLHYNISLPVWVITWISLYMPKYTYFGVSAYCW